MTKTRISWSQSTAIKRSNRCGRNSAAARLNHPSTCPLYFPRWSTYRDPLRYFNTTFNRDGPTFLDENPEREGRVYVVCVECCSGHFLFPYETWLKRDQRHHYISSTWRMTVEKMRWFIGFSSHRDSPLCCSFWRHFGQQQTTTTIPYVMTDISASKRESLPGWEPGSVAALQAAVAAASSPSGGPYPTVGLYSNQSGSSGGSNSGNGAPPPPHLPSPYSSFSQPIPSSSASSSTPYAQPQGTHCGRPFLVIFREICHFWHLTNSRTSH